MLPELDMNMWYSWLIVIVLLAIGVFLLVKCSDKFVDGSSSIAKKMKIPPLIIGLTVVAFGTSCPELAVSVSDSITCLIEGGNANVAIGNIVGSNICNLLVVLGFSAVFTPIIVNKKVCRREFPILLGVSVLFAIFGIFFSLDGQYAILRWEGIIFIVGIIAYIVYIVLSTKKNKEEADEAEEIADISTFKSVMYILIGIVGIALGGELVVYSSKTLAIGIGDAAKLNHDLVESLVGLTVVAVGTSLPELVTSVIAAKKGQNDMALGNVIGSNIFNILFVIGIAATVNPLTVGSQIVIDLAVMLSATVIVFIMGLNKKIDRKEGAILLALYVGYLTYLIIRTVI